MMIRCVKDAAAMNRKEAGSRNIPRHGLEQPDANQLCSFVSGSAEILLEYLISKDWLFI